MHKRRSLKRSTYWIVSISILGRMWIKANGRCHCIRHNGSRMRRQLKKTIRPQQTNPSSERVNFPPVGSFVAASGHSVAEFTEQMQRQSAKQIVRPSVRDGQLLCGPLPPPPFLFQDLERTTAHVGLMLPTLLITADNSLLLERPTSAHQRHRTGSPCGSCFPNRSLKRKKRKKWKEGAGIQD